MHRPFLRVGGTGLVTCHDAYEALQVLLPAKVDIIVADHLFLVKLFRSWPKNMWEQVPFLDALHALCGGWLLGLHGCGRGHGCTVKASARMKSSDSKYPIHGML